MRVTSHGNKKYSTTVLSEESSDDASTSDDASIEVTHVALQPTMKVFPSLIFSLSTPWDSCWIAKIKTCSPFCFYFNSISYFFY